MENKVKDFKEMTIPEADVKKFEEELLYGNFQDEKELKEEIQNKEKIKEVIDKSTSSLIKSDEKKDVEKELKEEFKDMELSNNKIEKPSLFNNSSKLDEDLKDDENELKEDKDELKEDLEVKSSSIDYDRDANIVIIKSDSDEVEANKTDKQKFLDKIIIDDLSSIDIIEKDDAFQINEDIDFILNGKGTFQVIASQSCYVAFLESLSSSDINSITNSTLDNYQSKKKLFQVIHSKINNTSVGKIDFKTFLKITSYFDLPTLYYGVYVQTFPGNTDFSIKCSKCGGTSEVRINNDALIAAKDESIYKRFEEITESITKPMEAFKNSLVHTYKRIILKESKIVIDIQTPSLEDYLNIIGSIKEPDKMSEIKNIVTTLLFIKSLLILDIKATKQKGHSVYYPVKSRGEIVNIISNMDIRDFRQLNKVIEERIDKYQIDYKIKSFACPKCGKQVGDIPIDIENMLFLEILQ